jgi:hypothetical protein
VFVYTDGDVNVSNISHICDLGGFRHRQDPQRYDYNTYYDYIVFITSEDGIADKRGSGIV